MVILFNAQHKVTARIACGVTYLLGVIDLSKSCKTGDLLVCISCSFV